MKNRKKFTAILAVIILAVFLVTGCSAAVEVEEEPAESEPEASISEESNNDCDEIRDELDRVKNEYQSLSRDYTELQVKYADLEKSGGDATVEYDELMDDYNALEAEYAKLNDDYLKILHAERSISTGDTEQAVFAAINEDRVNNGLNALEWSDNLDDYAREHTEHLAAEHILKLSDLTFWQQVDRVAGYATAEQVATGLLRVWKEDTTYAGSFLNTHAKYGAVAVVRTGDVYYITYFAHMED